MGEICKGTPEYLKKQREREKTEQKKPISTSPKNGSGVQAMEELCSRNLQEREDTVRPEILPGKDGTPWYST